MLSFPIAPRVCVRCITFNHSRYIIDAMDGFVMQQTFFPFVCVILDDASQDGEPSIITKYIEDNFNLCEESGFICEETEDYRMMFARHKSNFNCYFAAFLLKYNHVSVNKSKDSYFSGLLNRTEYIALCEGDDYWVDPFKLQKQVNLLNAQSNAALVHTRFVFFNEEAETFVEDTKHDIQIKQVRREDMNRIPYYILEDNRYRIQTMTVMYRLSCYYDVQKYQCVEQGLFQMGDTQLWLNLFQVGEIAYIPEVTSVYRVHNGSDSQKIELRKRLRFALSCEEMRYYYSRKLNLSIGHFYFRYLRRLIKYKIIDPAFISDSRIISWDEYDFLMRLLIRTNFFKVLSLFKPLISIISHNDLK